MLAGLRQWMRSYPLVVALIALAIGTGAILIAQGGGSLTEKSLLRMALSAIMILIIVLAGGAAIFRGKQGAMGFSLKKAIYPLCVSLALGLFMLASRLYRLQSGESELAANWPLLLLMTAVFCLFIGLFEELLFRAITFDAFNTLLGSTKRGVILAMIISSLIFGAVHLLASLLGGIELNVETILQMFLKTVQTGMIGFLLAAIYLKTRSIWGIALIHALDDFFLMSINAVFNARVGADYVIVGETSGYVIIVYIVMILLSIPFVVSALRIVKTTPLPAETIFNEAISSKKTLD